MTHQHHPAIEDRAAATLSDPLVAATVREGQDYMRERLAVARDELDWEAWRSAVAEVRGHTIAHLAEYLEQFIANVEDGGGRVHCAADAAEARAIIADLVGERRARLVVKSKSMVSEEIALNPALEALGVEVVETDLGEFIIQEAGERPFHLVAPAMHKSLDQIHELFSGISAAPLSADAAALTAFARRRLREKFLRADVGISGVNFGVADRGSLALLTNEGNGRLTTTLPPTHIAVMGIERLVPDLASLESILTLLPWAGGGERLTSYFTLLNGPRRSEDQDGPRELHVVLVDNGRSRLLGGKYQDVLHCIRCGACLDVCPVFRHIGGHAYAATYSGPIGAVLSPLLEGMEQHGELPFASSLCGACSEVCSAKIPLAEHLLELRRDAVAGGREPMAWRAAMTGYAEATTKPRLFALGERLAHLALRPLARGAHVRRAPGPLAAWTRSRDLPLPVARSFRELWRRRGGR